jgi:hypothetical protein
MPNRARLEYLYGPDGADLVESAPGTGIATEGGVPVHVHFRGSRAVTDETLRIVGRLAQLQEVAANETSISDAGLAHLGLLPDLRLLHLNQTQVRDAGLVHLEALPLEVLDLCYTRVTDAGLERLYAIKSLKEVWVIGCGCSDEALTRLRSALPGCKVIAEDNSVGR